MAGQGSLTQGDTKIRYGMASGGQGAFIGDVYGKSVALGGMAELAAGCFSLSLENTLTTGRDLGIPSDRCYETFGEMAETEAKRQDKIDFVVIVSPNGASFDIAAAFLSRGIHVMCDKPITMEVERARELADLAKRNNLLCGVTRAHAGYPAIGQIREMVRGGEIGEIRFVNAEYHQEWTAALAEKAREAQASREAGPDSAQGIAFHVENIVARTTGLKIKSLCARIDNFSEDRASYDTASIMLDYEGGAKGLYWSSQIASGYSSGLRLRILGSGGAIQWSQESPDYIEIFKTGKPGEQWSRNKNGFHPHSRNFARIRRSPSRGHLEAPANAYKAYMDALAKAKAGHALNEIGADFPDAEMEVDGVKFINKCIESSENGAAWVHC